ncbi:CBS domain-containing protein [Pseudalkalibacillus caeni]|uniref:CBS domain-containing protein n=1 Tax=Exobacillus caeni TaxID=2574798 RepID=A0A5R9FBS8_9BACL|nr:CBS domain-containing protein [Pseudalkalibacillus caeni]TLS38004.1 CBS domain-containing protein [Pseudalkalibacillus caeni]
MQNNLQNVMASQVVSISPTQSIQEAAALMSQYNIGSLPVVENGQLRGIVTDRDITLRATASGGDGKTTVSQCMTSNVVSATPDMTTDQAAALMAQNQIRRLPVVQNNQLVGYVALGDLATKTPQQQEAGQALSSISVPSEPQQGQNGTPGQGQFQ